MVSVARGWWDDMVATRPCVARAWWMSVTRTWRISGARRIGVPPYLAPVPVRAAHLGGAKC